MSDRLREVSEIGKAAVGKDPLYCGEEPPEIEAERRRWRALAARIVSGEEEASAEFRRQYSVGVRVMLRRVAGSIGLEALVDETLSGALEEIRRGSLQQPVHFVHFVRSIIERQQAGEGTTRRPARTPSAGLTSMDRARLKETTNALEEALMSFSKREREILVGYYSRGLTSYDLECTYGIVAEDLMKLRVQLQEMVRPHRQRKPPRNERRTVLLRRAATAG